jgi:hypothetical protein
MERMYDDAFETHVAKRGMACFGQRFIYWAENSPLTNNSSEHISEDCSFTRIGIISKRQTLFETNFAIGRDQMCQASDDKFTKFL